MQLNISPLQCCIPQWYLCTKLSTGITSGNNCNKLYVQINKFDRTDVVSLFKLSCINLWSEIKIKQDRCRPRTALQKTDELWPARCQWSCSWWNRDDRERRWLWCSTLTSQTSTAKCRSWYRARARLSICPEPRRIWMNLCPSTKQIKNNSM